MNTIKCFKGLPIEYESFLIEKYDSFITTCGYIEVHAKDYEINYMLVFNNAVLIELLIFGNCGNASTCFNSLVSIDQNIIAECTKKLFEQYPVVHKIEIVASYNEYAYKKAVLHSTSDNHILDLPATMDDYFSELGQRTRKNIRNLKSKFLRDYPQVNFVTKFGIEIEESLIDKIIQLNSERMKQKGNIPGIDNVEKNNIYQFSQYYGCVAYVEIDGVIVAGSINTILNKGIFGHVTAYDINFSKYNVGEICALYLIQASIERGLTTFQFLWGESEYKKKLLAKPHLLFSYFIYRAYSFDYLFSKNKALLSRIIIRVKHSKYSKPIRDTVKFYRKRKMQMND